MSRSLERQAGPDAERDAKRDNLAGEHTSLYDRVEAHYTAHHLAHHDTQGLMRHVLDCLGALRVTAPHDASVSPALKRVFQAACLVFLGHIARDEDASYDDLSAAGHIMSSFPDESKRRDGRGWLPLHWAAMTETSEEDMEAIARDRPLAARTFHTSPAAASSVQASEVRGEHNLLPLHLVCSSRHPHLGVSDFLSLSLRLSAFLARLSSFPSSFLLFLLLLLLLFSSPGVLYRT